MPATSEKTPTLRQRQSWYSNAVLKYGADSDEANKTRLEFYTAKHCAELTDTLSKYDLTDEQRRRIAHIALTVGREVTMRTEDGTLITGEVFGAPTEPN